MKNKIIQQNDPTPESFCKSNPDFDILNFDFHNEESISELSANLEPGSAPKKLKARRTTTLAEEKSSFIESMKGIQRALRISPDRVVAEKLIEKGYDSANKIAAMPQRKFVRLFAPHVGSEEKAAEIHQTAVHISEVTTQLYGNIKDVVASPYYNAANFKTANADINNYFKKIPSYQELFGSLDYLEGDECHSVFSPAAYFLDIMRITDEYISDPNLNPVRTIPSGYTLEERRPDLFEMELNGGNTNTVMPYLELVNGILKKNIECNGGIKDAYKTLSVGTYPFQLPFNLPLAKIRGYLGRMEMSLHKVFRSILATDGKDAHISAFDTALELLGISYQQFKLISEENYSEDGLTASYGYNILCRIPSMEASGKLLIMKDRNSVTGAGTLFTSEIKANDKIIVGNEIKTVAVVTSDARLTVDTAWKETAGSVYSGHRLSPQTIAGEGRITFNPDETKVVGVNTAFTRQVRAGDTVNAAKQDRIVAAVVSDAEITVNEPWPQFGDEVSYKLTTSAATPFQGGGSVIVVKGSAVVVGMESSFDTEFKVGDSIEIQGVAKKVASIESATVLTAESAWEFDLGAVCTIMPQPALKKITGYLPHEGAGTLAFGTDDQQVKGTGTRFKTELAAGDQIRGAGGIRTVVTILSDTELAVSAKWNIAAQGASFDILPLQGLDVVDNFISRTGLSRSELDDLLIQDLSPAELEAGGADDFFINHTGEGAFCLQTYFAEDPANPVQRIEGITLKRLDRLNRFIRLKQITGWSFTDLNRLLATCSPPVVSGMDENFILYLSQVKTLQQSLADITIPALTAFWSDLKTSGKASGRTPQDIFDTVYNNPLLLDGKNPYKDDALFNPFKEPVQEWRVAEIEGVNGVVRSRLSAALGLDSDSVAMLGNYVCALTGAAAGVLPLTLSNFSWLYRISQWSALLDLSLDELLVFLCLQYYPSAPHLNPPVNSIPLAPETYSLLSGAKQKTGNTGLDVYQLGYVLKGETGPHYQPPYLPSAIASFCNELATIAVVAQLKASDFIFESIGKDAANFIFAGMQERYVTESGIFKRYEFEYDDAAAYFPVATKDEETVSGFYAGSFNLFYADITVEESKKVFDELVNKGLLILTADPSKAILSDGYTDETDLSFLDPVFDAATAGLKLCKAGMLLSQCRSAIEHTLQVWGDTEKKQEKLLDTGLSAFIGSSPETVRGLKKYAAVRSGLPQYLAAFLTPADVAAPQMENFVKTLSRSSLLADMLPLSEKEAGYITENDGSLHFNIAGIDGITLDDVLSLIAYRKLAADFGDANEGLVAYFKLPKDVERPGNKINKLSLITGWNAEQICTLIALFWPEGSGQTKDYDTVAGLVRLQAAFDTAKKLGADISTLLAFSGIGRLDLDPSEKFSDARWEVYQAIAAKAVSLAGGMFDAAAFSEAGRLVQEALNTQTRDALLPFSIWMMSAGNPQISKPSDLYNYLLIDVEMSGCGQTSRIAQGIASVQLYMQRCRMMMEAGVCIIDIPKIWWNWMSNYSVWEVNRKIFLYPENYIEPTLRKKVTPPFKGFSDDLLQNELNKDTVQEPYQKYLQQIDMFGSLVHVAGYNTTRLDANTGQKKETLFLFGRTNTQPYSYYMRKLDDFEDWGPWLKIDIAINASSITPVYGFDRIFIFWSEKNLSQSSVVKGQESSTETVEMVDLKYSFYDGKKWVHPQVLYSSMPVSVFPLNYTSANNKEIAALLDTRNASWNIPYVFLAGKGFSGKGKAGISEGMQVVSGTKTQFLREVKKGDVIWCMGEKRVVRSILDNVTMLVAEPWTLTADNCSYKIVPSGGLAQTPPFSGSGKVTVTATLQNVSGEGTKFSEELAYGDSIVVGGETRTVRSVLSDTELIVDSLWKKSATDAGFTIMLKTDAEEQLIVVLGEDLPTSYGGDVVQPEKQANPTKNRFVDERNTFNQNLFSSLNLAKRVKNDIAGSVTVGPVQVIGSNLLNSSTILIIPDYKYASATNPQPYRVNLDRQQASLSVIPDDNLLRNNYWGNNISEMANNSGENKALNPLSLLLFADKIKSSLISVGNQPGWFLYDNSDEAFLIVANDDLNKLSDMALVEFMPNYRIIGTQAFAAKPAPFNDLKFKFTRLTTNVTSLLMQKLFAGGIDNLLTLRSQEIRELPFNRFYAAAGDTPPENVIAPESSAMDFDGAYGLYFWEVFFHGPFLIADRLNSNKRYEDAKQWLEYIFNPTINEDDSANPDPAKRYWRFRPFRSMNRETLRELLTSPAAIRRYNFDPFDPDAIAKYRPVAYAKATVMKYIDNILDWGDFLFAQDTSESVSQATNLYVLASDLLGKRPEPEGKIPVPEPKTFNDIKKQYAGGIPQFLIELENTPEVFSAENQAAVFAQVPFNKINSYFNVPENSDFMAYWDKVEDRLYKIRHCQNINGVFRQLPLFAPPLDPRAFIRALASGGSSFGLVPSFSAPIPFFRFSYLIEKARGLTAQVTGLGNSLLSALEKKDAEALGLISRQQEKVILQMTAAIKEMQIKAIDEQMVLQQESLNSAHYRFTYYHKLITKGISEREQVSIDAAKAAMVFNTMGSITKTAASIGYAVPQVGSPFAMTYGGQQLGSVLNAASGAFEIASAISNYISHGALTMAGYDRRNEDWSLQREIARYDELQIKALLKQSGIQKQIAQQDVTIHEQMIRNNDHLEAFYKNKFTNKELYQWMSTRISAIYFQAYNLAYAMAKAAERAYQFQYNTDRMFIRYGHWDDAYKGLLAGESLMQALDGMESDCILDNGCRLLEIEKTVSLLQLNPKALLDLKTKGECIFEMNEKLFDSDFPGHYARKIKTISVSVPAVIGPYQNIHATLTQLSNQLVMTPDRQGLDAVNYLLGGSITKMPDSAALRSDWWVNQQIAISKGVNDSGLFELNFEDPRFLPFEGTGAVSVWRLSMPLPTNRINFDAISDVLIHLKYTAKDGGGKFRGDVAALKALRPYSGAGYWNFNQVFSGAWHAFMKDHAAAGVQTLDYEMPDFVPPHIVKAKLTGFYFKLDAAAAEGAYITFKISDNLSVPVKIGPGNDCTYTFKADKKTEPDVNKLPGRRSIAVDLAAAPAGLKTKDNFLDPETVRNIQVIFYYTGETEN